MNPFEKLAKELKRLEMGYREESYYRPLCDFLEGYATGKEYLHMLDIKATNNPGSESIGQGVGFPDIEVRQNQGRRLIGYIEVKSPNQNLDSPAFSAQFNKYKESLENIIFTNFKKWVLYAWDKDGKPQKTEEAEWDYQVDQGAERLKRLLTVFFEGQSYQAKTPHQLAIALARKTKLLSQQVEEALLAKSPDKKLADLKKTFERTLIQDISDHQFANIYSETIAYSLFLAKLEHYKKGSGEDFTLRTAVDYLPKNVPVFKDLYQLTGGRVEPVTLGIYKATEIIIEQLNFAAIEKIYRKLVEHKPGEDPVIQFYEPFLSEYDPEERKSRGVYYTPKPVVDYIVRSVDFILKTKFKKPKGLGDESVQILDPATGTGTFLMSVIQNIYADIEKENKPLGDEAVKRKFKDVVSNHILKHLYGFELMVAPYAIAHLKLTLELERLGFNFSMTQDDSDKENDRLKIFLANTLDDPNKPPQSLFGFESITEESEKARLVKKDEPILVITGNPPYSGTSENVGKYATGIVKEAYYSIDGNALKENNTKWLLNDYVKFLRFSQKKIDKEGFGIVGMITSNSYIDSPIFRGMRQNLLDSFNEIYILNLHGNAKKKEVLPNGISKDENVFKITEGVCIAFFVKLPNIKSSNCQVYFDELWGKRQEKFTTLLNLNLNEQKWKLIKPISPKYLFIPQDESLSTEFSSYISILDIFSEKSLGALTKRDGLAIDFTKIELLDKIRKFSDKTQEDQVIANKFELPLKDKDRWDLKKTRQHLKENLKSEFCKNIFYRPFDERYIYYDEFIVARRNIRILHNLNKDNLALITTRQLANTKFTHALVSSKATEQCFISNKTKEGGYVFPLYLYPEDQIGRLSFFGEDSRKTNIKEAFINYLKNILNLNYVPSGTGDLNNTFGPEDVFYYVYGILHSSKYRARYAEQLRDEFPRIFFSSNVKIFGCLVGLGKELVNFHLLGKNPFDKSKTIFDDTSKWNVKIGGEKPQNIEDWKVMEVRYDEKTKQVYVNSGQYFEGIDEEVWEFMVGGYQVLDKWLKDRKKSGRTLSYEDQIHYMKVIVSLRETIRIMKEIDESIPSWPIK